MFFFFKNLVKKLCKDETEQITYMCLMFGGTAGS